MREYSVTIAPTAVTAQVDLFEITPAANKPVEIQLIKIFQTSDVGDAQEEIIGVEIRRGGTGMTSGSGGSAPTPIPLASSDTAAGATAEILNTTLATFTAGVLVDEDGWNVRAPFMYLPAPEHRVLVSAVNVGLVVRLAAAPADSLTIGGTLIFAELG